MFEEAGTLLQLIVLFPCDDFVCWIGNLLIVPAARRANGKSGESCWPRTQRFVALPRVRLHVVDFATGVKSPKSGSAVFPGPG